MYGPLSVETDGTVTLPDPVSRAIIGLFDETHVVQTLDITAAAPDGNSMGRQKRIQSGTGLGLHRSVAGTVQAVETEIGQNPREMAAVPVLPRPVADALNQGFSGVTSLPAPSGFAKELALKFKPMGGAPLTITAIIPPVQEAGR
jgi:hypothetical protein